MGALALWLKSKLFGSSTGILLMVLVALLLLIVLPNLDQIKEKLGFETRTSLKVQVLEQEKTIDTLQASNSNLSEAIAIDSVTDELKDQAVEQQAIVIEAAREDVKEVIKVKSKKIKAIKKVSLDDTKSISKIQIQAIWASYCDFNTHSECPGVSA